VTLPVLNWLVIVLAIYKSDWLYEAVLISFSTRKSFLEVLNVTMGKCYAEDVF
jgi:hypothetical protein